MKEKIRGYLKLILFESNNGYRICKFQLENDKNRFLFIKGFLSVLHPDQLYELTGEFTYTERYGENFMVTEIKQIAPQTTDDLLKYFTSSLFPTIGPKAAQAIIDYYQENIIDKIKKDLTSLNKVPNLSPKQVKIITKTFLSMSRDDELNHLFSQNNLSLEVLSLLKTKYNIDQIHALLSKDPYSLLLKDTIPFKTIDKIYLVFNTEIDSNIRVGYYAWFLTKEFCNQTGDTYLLLEQLTIILQKHFVDLTKEKIIAGLLYVKENKLLVFKNEKIYDAEIYHSELNIATMITDLNTTTEYDEVKLEEVLNTLKQQKHITYNTIQAKAIKAAVTSNFLVIIGGPGTGKTTVVDGIVGVLKKIYRQSKIVLAAPTGKAAKRLREKTQQKALTIHKLLKYDALSNQFFYNENNPLESNILILDEVSMVDTVLLSQIAKAGRNLEKIILIGDPNQLPSVACGDILRDIIESNVFNVIKLKDVYRQEAGNDILELSYAVEQEQFEYNLLNKKDITFFEHDNPKEIIKTVSDLYQDLVDNNVNDYNHVQVIAPMYNGPVGINILNTYLQEHLNPSYGQKELKIGHRLFRVHDKVMQLKNRPELEVYNGDVGIIIDIKVNDNLNPILLIQYDDNIVEYNKELYYDITLAYACSVHKLQGSEYDNIIFVITKSFWIMLKRNLIYTAITRAKRNLFLVGQQKAFIQGVNNLPEKRRTTLCEAILHFYDKLL